MQEELEKAYQKLQKKYGDPSLDPILFGGKKSNPDLCLVFMNPTGRNIASKKEWKGIKAPWIGTKNIWKLLVEIGAIDSNIYEEIKQKKPTEWSEEFASKVYQNIEKNNVFITNLAKCTQIDARVLKDEVYIQYLKYFWKEMKWINPKKIILFGNQVSSIVLEEKISVSQVRQKEFQKNQFTCYAVYYPVGNGIFNMEKAIEDIKYIMK